MERSSLTDVDRRVRELDDRFDSWWDRWRGHPVADRIFFGASNLGDWSLIWHLLGAIRALGPSRRPENALEVSAVMAVESALVNGALKRIFKRSRPATAAENTSRHRLRQPVTSSFPSGHASAAFTAAAILSRGSRLRPLYYAVATVVSLSRIHVRLHHASDVAGGVVTGVILGKIASRVLDHRD